MMADKLPIRSDAAAMANQPGPVGAIGPFAERGQTADGGDSMAVGVGAPDALGTGGNAAPFKVKG